MKTARKNCIAYAFGNAMAKYGRNTVYFEISIYGRLHIKFLYS